MVVAEPCVSVLPEGVRRIIVEAAHPMSWHRFMRPGDTMIGIDHFGASAPYQRIYKEFGITVDAVVAGMRAEARRLESLRVPGGVESPAYRDARATDARELHWYTGPRETDRYWGHLRRQIEASSLAPVLPEIDAASTKVVAHFADPGIRRLKKKGLVLGYVQSGKTANYAAVAASQ